MFMGPFDQFISRNTNGLKGVKKFIDKVVALWDKVDLSDTNDCRDRSCTCPNGEAVNNKTNTSPTSCRDDGLPRPNGEAVNNATSTSTCKNDGCSRPNPEGVTTPKDIEILLHQTIKKTTEDIDAFRFNTTISQFMILVNKLSELDKIHKDVFQTFIILLAPFAPHLAEEFRSLLGNEFSIFTKAQRPTYDEKKLISDTINLAIQFNGKVRGTIEITSSASEEEVLALMKTNDKLNTYLESGSIRKIIYVPGKIMNVVIG
ncbi:MAG: class I tRNA ligase family protein [Candidatus Peribacteria bacterium]|jgi:leucyl-tRNA synthetase|nr:class I tRNA ligase family protein [Candidatus Peribacteria bacterium]